tara:strand:- start:223 stop:441 length:219 start_codon:yes stop_codon:yes gene_type:complete
MPVETARMRDGLPSIIGMLLIDAQNHIKKVNHDYTYRIVEIDGKEKDNSSVFHKGTVSLRVRDGKIWAYSVN